MADCINPADGVYCEDHERPLFHEANIAEFSFGIGCCPAKNRQITVSKQDAGNVFYRRQPFDRHDSSRKSALGMIFAAPRNNMIHQIYSLGV